PLCDVARTQPTDNFFELMNPHSLCHRNLLDKSLRWIVGTAPFFRMLAASCPVDGKSIVAASRKAASRSTRRTSGFVRFGYPGAPPALCGGRRRRLRQTGA